MLCGILFVLIKIMESVLPGKLKVNKIRSLFVVSLLKRPTHSAHVKCWLSSLLFAMHSSCHLISLKMMIQHSTQTYLTSRLFRFFFLLSFHAFFPVLWSRVGAVFSKTLLCRRNRSLCFYPSFNFDKHSPNKAVGS